MERHECIEILKQLKLTAMAENFDDVVIDGIRRKRSTMDIIGNLLTTEQHKDISAVLATVLIKPGSHSIKHCLTLSLNKAH
ncbi:putative NTP-binding protein [Yersinia enterocolitica]|nr:putative NTP-binding protein [Yersinia enterocolitica]